MNSRDLVPTVALAVLLAGCAHTSQSTSTDNSAAVAAPAALSGETALAAPKVHKLASGLIYEDIVIGNGKMADPGLTVIVHYTGHLMNGTMFQSSHDSGTPLTYQLGATNIIAGWNQGIKGMRVGGTRKLTIPPDMAYGAQGRGDVIPPNSTLLFDIELLGVK